VVNKNIDSSSVLSKSIYKSFIFDFFKPEGGMDKITLHTPHAKGKKKDKKILINTFLVSIGDSCKLDYAIEEES
jgi:hypothetical protein